MTLNLKKGDEKINSKKEADEVIRELKNAIEKNCSIAIGICTEKGIFTSINGDSDEVESIIFKLMSAKIEENLLKRRKNDGDC